MCPVEISTVSHRTLTVFLHSPNGRQMHAVRAVPGDCEESTTKLDVKFLFYKLDTKIHAYAIDSADWDPLQQVPLRVVIINV